MRMRAPFAWVGASCGLVLIFALAVAAFPVGWVRTIAEKRLSDRLGVPVAIGSIERVDALSFVPRISLSNVTIGQPEWVGAGRFLVARDIRVRLPILPLLLGHVRPRALAVSGVTLDLMRTADGRSNWKRRGGGDRRSTVPSVSTLVISDARFRLRDAKRHLTLAGSFAADAAAGLTIRASGNLRGRPALLAAHGGRLNGIDPAAAYPFAFRFASPLVTLHGSGAMAGALATDRFTARMEAAGQDFHFLDDIIQAGLPGTQDFALAGLVRHDGRDWFLSGVSGRLGRSHFVAVASVRRRDGRSRIDAAVHARDFDFDDLASDAGLARAAAKHRTYGDRVIPDTRIDLSRLARTDGVLRFRGDRLLVKGRSIFRSLAVTARLDHRVLTADDIVAGMAPGAVTGSVRVDHREGLPKFSLDLRMRAARVAALGAKPNDVSAPLAGHARLSGEGETIRAALARGSGSIGVAAGGGRLDAALAAALGQDIGRAIGFTLSGEKERSGLRCLAARFEGRGGLLRAAPLVIDADRARADGGGTIDLAGERIALNLTGADKGRTVLRFPGPVEIAGTFSHPSVHLGAPGVKEKSGVGKLLAAVGHAIGDAVAGREAPRAADADCARLTAAALR